MIDLVVASCEVVSVVLALLDIATGIPFAAWIPMVIMLASTLSKVRSHLYAPSQLAAASSRVEKCHSLLVHWDSLSLVQRKARETKKQCCLSVEGALLELCAAQTGVLVQLPSVDDSWVPRDCAKDGGGQMAFVQSL